MEAVLAAGGRIVDRTAEHWTLSDRAGNRVGIGAWPDGGSTAGVDVASGPAGPGGEPGP